MERSKDRKKYRPKKTRVVFVFFVCFIQRAIAAETQSHVTDNLEAAKKTMTGFLESAKQTVSETLDKFKDPETVKKAESDLRGYMSDAAISVKKYGEELSSAKTTETGSGFFSTALSKLKNAFSSTKTENPDDKFKQEAIKAFDDYADKHPRKLK